MISGIFITFSYWIACFDSLFRRSVLSLRNKLLSTWDGLGGYSTFRFRFCLFVCFCFVFYFISSKNSFGKVVLQILGYCTMMQSDNFQMASILKRWNIYFFSSQISKVWWPLSLVQFWLNMQQIQEIKTINKIHRK